MGGLLEGKAGPDNGISWSFQFCSRFGWYQLRDDAHPMRSRYVDYAYWQKYCDDFFNGTIPGGPQFHAVNAHYGDIGQRSSYIMFVYGIDDPWQGAEMREFPDPVYAENNHLKIIVADCDSCAHCIDLHEDRELNPQGLQKAHTEMRNTLWTWFRELDGADHQFLQW